MISVLIPFRPDGAQRDRNLAWILDAYRTNFPDWQVIVGEHSDGPWCKAAAVAQALREASGATLVVADGDVWPGPCALAEAAQTDGWAVPHLKVWRLTEDATVDYLAGGPDRSVEQDPYTGRLGGGIVVLSRELYDECPLDPRFQGWGQEDESWGTALTTLAGKPHRGTADLVHLWHPPQERLNRRDGNTEGRRLYRRYRAARKHTERMRALVAEAKEAAWTSPVS